MKCPHCNVETGKATAAYFCPDCAMPLGWVNAGKWTRQDETRLQTREKPRTPPTAPVAIPTSPVSPGALLTGNVRGDFLLGVLNEPVAIALAAFGVWQLLSAPMDNYPLLPALGQIATGAFMLWHGANMRERYSAIANGFKRWRGVTGWCGDHLKTLLCGAFVLAILFPLAAGCFLFVQIVGMVGWIPVLLVIYGLGIIARRIRGEQPKRKQRLQNG
ncbi:MAG: hypothetical protein H7Y38_03105 [Armatimonadetes bacterium]|nr:hypothetical protein [Armatimonadota bacterium]